MDNNTQHKHNQPGHPLLIVALAIAIAAVLSLVPWGRLTDHQLKDFSLVSDLTGVSADDVPAAAEVVDPALLAEMEVTPNGVEEVAANDTENTDAKEYTENETVESYRPEVPVDEAEPRIDGEMVIEDYTPDQSGLSRLKASLQSGKLARIAFLGDSYIEGDIFTQDVRRLLQEQYGGRGVGYMPAHSQVSGFRQTVRHSDSGWQHFTLQRAAGSKNFTIMGDYCKTDSAGGTIKYSGTKKLSHLDAWNSSTILFIAPHGTHISITTDAGTQNFDVEASDLAQAIIVEGETTTMRVSISTPGVIFLGAYINDDTGIAVDCMSNRGDSGITHRKVNADLAQQLRQWADYDLIVLEYGINALTADNFNYSSYTKLMAQTIDRIRQSYPNAQILIMGIGDRGQKVNGEVHSLPSAPHMVAAQRKLARDIGCLFWDTREAMGGEDAIVDWRERKLVNGDYIHLNSAGGNALAKEFVKSLNTMLADE